MTEADIIIIGSGPGGFETAARAASQGKKVVLIEKDHLGGTCLNRGCIPTKCLARTAEVLETLRHASELGVSGVTGPAVDLPVAMARKDAVVAELREGVATVLKDVTVVKGTARFTDRHTVDVDGENFTAPVIIIATGSAPASLPVKGAEMAMTSDDLLSIEALPASLAIIGGGVIGMEFASVCAAFGVKVTVLEFLDEILPALDAEVAKRLRMSLKRRGITVNTGARVTAIQPGMQVVYEQKGKEKTVEAEAVLMAVGRKAVIPEGLDAVTERGFIKTDDNFRVIFPDGPAEGVYAIGDVNGKCMLAHAATAQGEVVLGEKRDLAVMPAAVFTIPECAMVGLTEQQALARAYNIKVGKATFRSNGKALAMGEPDGMVKAIIDADSGKILGCHIMGPHAADLVQEVATAMTAGLSASAIAEAIHAHPTLGETLRAAFVG